MWPSKNGDPFDPWPISISAIFKLTQVWLQAWVTLHSKHYYLTKSFTVRFVLLPPPNRWCFYFGLFVCPSDNWKSCEWIFTKFLGEVGTKGINFGDDLDHCPDPGVWSPKSGFTGLSKKYLVDSDQSCIANLHCKNHSAILLCWRSAEVCDLWVLLVVVLYRLLPPAQRGRIVFNTVCLCVCLSVNSITPEPVDISSQNFYSIILWSKGQTRWKNGYTGVCRSMTLSCCGFVFY